MQTLRIIFTAIAVAFSAAVIPVGAIASWTWAVICILAAALFYGLMLLAKQKQEENAHQPRHDDFSGIDLGDKTFGDKSPDDTAGNNTGNNNNDK